MRWVFFKVETQDIPYSTQRDTGGLIFEKTLQKCPLMCPPSGENTMQCPLGCPSSGENAIQCHIPHRIQLVPFLFFSPLPLKQPESATAKETPSHFLCYPKLACELVESYSSTFRSTKTTQDQLEANNLKIKTKE